MNSSDFKEQTDNMVKRQLKARGISAETAEAFRKVSRENFVPDESREFAYSDSPLDIGYGQTISQPYIVAEMIDRLRVKEGCKVLEIGAGSGYQSVILAELGARVYAVEIVPELAEEAQMRITDCQNQLGLDINLRVGDGTAGWPEEAPFDRIIVAAAAPSVPEPFLSQLKEGGRIVIPVGNRLLQELKVIIKTEEGVRALNAGGCRFVPLIGEYGWSGK
ncbi:MAG: protein-L-isoaspartate(D-aspartate) O-methyltransferase [Elusimicrobia bacterium]|jgi:protein-L-isoaspartate(D-aspartate) O-methyltransferase|nr:protein-L-isoaspartate(D-aspartate) O-methyltransferase [Elusimicrobiota bacterium]